MKRWGRIGLRLLQRRLWQVRVSGDSMAPTYPHGALLLCEVLDRRSRLRPGDVVVFAVPPPSDGSQVSPEQEPLNLKRLAALPGDRFAHPTLGEAPVPAGHAIVLGDRPERSMDSRTFGPIPLDLIRARVI